jgi:hypothetical protein
MKLRPLSFTKNLGGLPKIYKAIQKGYTPGITVKEFRKKSKCSILIPQFFLFTQIKDGEEYIKATP